MTPHTAPVNAPPSAPAAAAASAPRSADAEGRLFLWLREVGVVREDGWLGGVCAAIAHRTGIDPLVVRGIVVAITVLGFPALWFYALAWALLPDWAGRIPLQMRTGSAPALLGAAATAAAGLLVTWAGNSLLEAVAMSAVEGWARPVLEAGFWFAGLGAVVFVLILLLRRRWAGSTLPLAGVDGAVSGTAAVSGGAVSGTAPPPSIPEPVEPLAPELATVEELEAWRAQHAAWREQHDAWRRAQADGSAQAEERARRAAERAAFRAEAARVRAERRAAKPRTSIAFVVITVGVAVVAATAVWLAFQPYADERAWQAAVLSAAAVTALAMVVAGIRRRRSGLLAAVSAMLLVIGGSGLATHAVDDLVGPDRYVPVTAGEQQISQPFGQLNLEVGGSFGASGVTRIEKGTGSVWMSVYPGADVEFRTVHDSGEVFVEYLDASGLPTRQEAVTAEDGRFSWQHDDPDVRKTRTIVLDQDDVDVYIQVWGEQ
ncbi:PspC domain-containing protein [Microbacterium sp. JZ31]|uniref:PspC domain-containing protein n=1 Tax=Microbacterium sp. JZ31 TaxID=1906274 RepID=UPI0019332A1E|nr:PspC domain-containing protein [Microbacterium sp. JZ31]